MTEVCAFYTREPLITNPSDASDKVHMKQWLLGEWLRSGLSRRLANTACGVADAATRKYFDQGWLWYMPPADAMEKLVNYANEYGDPEGRPYYSLDGVKPVTADQWTRLRYSWNFEYGATNVWSEPALRGKERFKGTGERSAPRVHMPTSMSSSHLNQKPLRLMRRIVKACTNQGDVVWEPFGGLCSASVAALELGRVAFAAEVIPIFAEIARERLEGASNPPMTSDIEL